MIVLFLFAYQFNWLLSVAQLAFFALLFALCLDIILLFRIKKGIHAFRSTPDKLSNGDENPLHIWVENHYPFLAHLEIIDELPFQFQLRNTVFTISLSPAKTQTIAYQLRPTERGAYHFGALNVFVSSPLGLAKRRYQFSQNKMVAVYPSFLQMRKYELMAMSNHLKEFGLKKIRRIGHSMEFEQIKEYVTGDDYRTVNWKATARRGNIMVNQFQDEKSQPIYSIIDKGRIMKMPFDGLTLLDYAINASLVISNIALKKGDKAGLLTFAQKVDSVLLAHRRGSQMRHIQELLYKERTHFLESDYEQLFSTLRRKVTQRSLLLLYTNFATVSGLQRQLPFLRQIAKRHLLVVIFFENTELKSLLQQEVEATPDIYQKIVAEQFAFEKKLIIKELHQHGIQAILTTPEQLTVNTINKYLELKSRGMI